ncbi:polyphosphate kinase 1, partial [Senegalimassilia anaerobia]|uniref:polyphosphate kinase 1 n=1 Tax=Senegalimassilia anaerobia TaxID=1473216 RepID=UPI0026EBE9DA
MKANESTTHIGSTPYMQNRELSWLTFNERVLDQGADETVPLLERLNFISIFWSNLQEFFMVRVGSLTDLSLLKKQVLDSKTGMTPAEQLSAIHKRCHELYPVQEQTYAEVRQALAAHGVRHLRPADLNDEQRAFLADYTAANIMPFLSPQIINSRHPFPHLENGSLYVIVRLNEEVGPKKPKKKDKAKDGKAVKAAKIHPSAEESENLGAEGVTVGILPMPRQCARVIKLPGEGFQFILLEHAVEMTAAQVFSMYTVKHTNVLCVTRNADLDATENTDESDEDYREHMKRILKKRGRLAPVRLESERPLSSVLQELLLDRLNLKPHQTYVTSVPLDMSWTWGLGSNLPEQERMALSNPPFTPQWPACLDRNRSIIEQVCEREVLLSYPYESMDAFVQLLREAAADPTVISIKITLYRLARQSHLAEALIAAAESGKQVTALFELRARFDESNNIEWSQRFEEAGCNVIYGFRDYKVHSKICCITRQTENGLQYITQLGTGNYNEKTAKLYTDLSFITADETIGRDATEFFRNMQLENASDNYDILSVAPLQIKPGIIANIDEQIALAREGKPCGLFFKTNSVTDKDIIVKIAEASQAGVPVTLLVRGISCLVPGVPGCTDNVRVVSIVGRLLEHSRIYGFGPRENIKIFLSSADLMTRNMEKRVEIAWPILDEGLRNQVLDYIATCLRDTAKLRELKADGTYTKLGELAKPDEPKFESQDFLIKEAQRARAAAAKAKAARNANSRKLMNEQRQAQMAEAEAKVEAVAKAEAAAAEAAREA